MAQPNEAEGVYLHLLQAHHTPGKVSCHVWLLKQAGAATPNMTRDCDHKSDEPAVGAMV